MFSKQENANREITVNYLDAECMKLVIDFFYTADILPCCVDTALVLFDAAERFQITGLNETLTSYVKGKL